MTKELLAKLGIVAEKDLTDEEVVEKLSKSLKDKDDELSKRKGLIDKYSSEISTLKKEKEARMTEEEKAQARLKELEEENATFKKNVLVAERQASYLGMGYSEELAKKVATAEVEGEPTFEYHKQFQKELVEKTKAETLKGMKTPNTNNGDTSKLTKKDFQKMGYEERLKLAQEYPDIYAEISKK